jgi:hypothetical protein
VVRWVDEVSSRGWRSGRSINGNSADRITELEMKLANLGREIGNGRLDLEPAAGMVRRRSTGSELVAVPHG